MDALAPSPPGKDRFRIARLEERIAPAGSLVNIAVVIQGINIPITVANNNIQIGIQALTFNGTQLLSSVTTLG
jgi:hypothetical protein